MKRCNIWIVFPQDHLWADWSEIQIIENATLSHPMIDIPGQMLLMLENAYKKPIDQKDLLERFWKAVDEDNSK